MVAGTLLVLAAAAVISFSYQVREEGFECIVDFCQLNSSNVLLVPLSIRDAPYQSGNPIPQLSAKVLEAHGVQINAFSVHQFQKGIYFTKVLSPRIQWCIGFLLPLYLLGVALYLFLNRTDAVPRARE